MADKGKEDAEVQEAPKKKKSKLVKLLIIIVPLLAVLGGGGWFAAKYFGLLGPKAPAQAEGEAKPKEKEEEKGGHGEKAEKGEKGEKGGKGVTKATLPPFVVNLSDPSGRRYLKVVMDVELVDAKSNDALTDNMPKVRDSIILLLSSKSYQELSAMEAKIELKKQIVDRLNQVLGGPKVMHVYFTDFVVQ